MDAEGFAIRRTYREERFAWSDIQRVIVERREMNVSLFGFSGRKEVRRVLRVVLSGRELDVDISKDHPEFADPSGIEKAFRSRLRVTEAADVKPAIGYWLYNSPLVAAPIFVLLGIWLLVDKWM